MLFAVAFLGFFMHAGLFLVLSGVFVPSDGLVVGGSPF